MPTSSRKALSCNYSRHAKRFIRMLMCWYSRHIFSERLPVRSCCGGGATRLIFDFVAYGSHAYTLHFTSREMISRRRGKQFPSQGFHKRRSQWIVHTRLLSLSRAGWTSDQTMSLRSVWDEITIIMDFELRILQAAWSVVSYMRRCWTCSTLEARPQYC